MAEEHAKEAERGSPLTADWLFAQDLSAYAGEWVAAADRKIVAHGPSLREVRARATQQAAGHSLRYYAVPGAVDALDAR